MNTPPPSSVSAIPDTQINRLYLWRVALAAALGGLLFGYDWVVIGGAAKFYETYFHLQDKVTVLAGAPIWERFWANAVSPVGWAQSCALLGCLAGALLSGSLSDRFGRKPLLIAAAANFVFSSAGIAFSETFGAFVLWRILGGVSIGLASNISPLYISELAPARSRGRLVALNQLTIVIGVLTAQLVNWLIADGVPAGLTPEQFATTWNVLSGWRWMFAACAVPSLLFLLCAFFVPESPRWLAKEGRTREAEKILERIGGTAYAGAAAAEIRATLRRQEPDAGFGDLCDRRLAGVLFLGVFLAVFQQWCGINVIFNYAGEIFLKAGFDLNDTLTNIVMTGVVNLAFTLVALGTVDRLGRKPLLLFGSAALAVLYVAVGSCYRQLDAGGAVPTSLFLSLVLAAIASYAMSLAPVTWVVISEIFPNRIRGTAMSVAVGFLWIACFLLTYTFPILNALLGAAATFWIYAGICALGCAFVAWKLPETKGKSLEQIENELSS